MDFFSANTLSNEEISSKSPEWPEPTYDKEEKLLEEIERLNRVIDSIKKQYEELMGVALQYREEAKKWYQKYIYGRHV